MARADPSPQAPVPAPRSQPDPLERSGSRDGAARQAPRARSRHRSPVCRTSRPPRRASAERTPRVDGPLHPRDASPRRERRGAPTSRAASRPSRPRSGCRAQPQATSPRESAPTPRRLPASTAPRSANHLHPRSPRQSARPAHPPASSGDVGTGRWATQATSRRIRPASSPSQPALHWSTPSQAR